MAPEHKKELEETLVKVNEFLENAKSIEETISKINNACYENYAFSDSNCHIMLDSWVNAGEIVKNIKELSIELEKVLKSV